MTVAQFLHVLVARWRAALLVFFGAIALIVVGTLMLPKKYTATAAVVLDVKSPDPIAGVVLPGMMVSGYMATQVDVLQSERVVLRALRALQADQDESLRSEWKKATEGRGDFDAWLAEAVAKRLEARPGKDSNVITVSYTDRDATVAAATANAVVKAYIETTLELRTEPAKQFNGLFGESTKTLRESLEMAQSKLSAFQQRKGIVATDERLDIENTRLSELSAQLVALEAAATESDGRQRQAGLKSDQMQEVLGNPMIQSLSADVARQQARLSEFGERLGEQNPQVQQLRANIEELRSRLSVEKGRIAGSVTVNNSVNQSRVLALRSDLAAQRSKLLQLKGLRDEATVLQRDVENAQRVYDAGFARLSQSTLESQATQTNVSVLKRASPPPFPSSPRLQLNIAIALVLGAVLALMATTVRERFDWCLRVDTDVLDVLKQPLLGVLPDGLPRRLAGRRGSIRSVAERVFGRSSLPIGS